MVWMLLFLLGVCPLLVRPARAAGRADDQNGKKQSEAAESEEHVYDLDESIKPPHITRQVNPDYSNVRGVRVKGSVVIAVVISSQGLTKDPRVIQSLQPEVDRCAVEAVKQWRFAPAQKDGKSVSVRVTIEVQFHSM